jgi:hypothetical protein
MKPKPGAKAKPAASRVSKVAPKTTKSRGSKTASQVGDMNQREWFNAQRDVKQKRSKSGKIIGSTIPGSKVSKAMSDLEGFDVADERKRQRAGGGLTRKNVNQSSGSLKSASTPRPKKSNKVSTELYPLVAAKGIVKAGKDTASYYADKLTPKSKNQIVKGGPRPKMKRMAQPAKRKGTK